MQGWWRRNTFYIEYMIHEGTAVFVAAYALVLLVGLVRLAQGQAAWDAWLAALRSPLSIAFHVIVLVAISYHAWTWFNIMPRTLPPIRLKANACPRPPSRAVAWQLISDHQRDAVRLVGVCGHE